LCRLLSSRVCGICVLLAYSYFFHFILRGRCSHVPSFIGLKQSKTRQIVSLECGLYNKPTTHKEPVLFLLYILTESSEACIYYPSLAKTSFYTISIIHNLSMRSNPSTSTNLSIIIHTKSFSTTTLPLNPKICCCAGCSGAPRHYNSSNPWMAKYLSHFLLPFQLVF